MSFVDVDGTFSEVMYTILVYLFCGWNSIISLSLPLEFCHWWGSKIHKKNYPYNVQTCIGNRDVQTFWVIEYCHSKDNCDIRECWIAITTNLKSFLAHFTSICNFGNVLKIIRKDKKILDFSQLISLVSYRVHLCYVLV